MKLKKNNIYRTIIYLTVLWSILYSIYVGYINIIGPNLTNDYHEYRDDWEWLPWLE